MSVRVRAVQQTDLTELVSLYQHLNPDDEQPTSEVAEDRWFALKRFSGSEIFVVVVDDMLVASCTLIVIPNLTRGGAPYALIENVVTHTAFRKRGFGTAVLREAVETAWSVGCYKVMLLTGSRNPSTIRFYGAVGFEQSKTGFQIHRIAARVDPT